MENISGIVVATSIPPKTIRYDESGREVGQAYQQSCIQSWTDAGFRILSLNFPEETPHLISHYPMVDFITVDCDNATRLGRKTPLISDFLRVLAEQNERIIGILNADILLENHDWINVINRSTRKALAVAHRADVLSLDCNDPVSYRDGYDLFFMERKSIPQGITYPFAMGLPWWDYCLPIYSMLRGLPVNIIASPMAFHLQHAMNYMWESWQYMAHEFAKFVLEYAAGASPETLVQEHLSPVIKLSRKIAAKRDIVDDISQTPICGRLLSAAGRLPLIRRYTDGHDREAKRHRLSAACVEAIDTGQLPRAFDM